ncbi:MAG: hypothetical protein KAU01_10285 [Candidatus Cloacimonetes bacterium]|nr:hypothetical protein [Candidatus Cloacimonadota bacterium]
METIKDNGKKYFQEKIKKNFERIFLNIKFIVSSLEPRKISMKNIEEIRDKNKGDTIFIAGSGPSLDTYPDVFLKSKISMTLHLAFLKFPNPTYVHISEADRIQWLKNNRPDFFEIQGLFNNPFYPLVYPNSILKNVGNISPYFLKYNPKRLKIKDVEKQIISALTGKNIRYSSNGTCLHTGIWCALILGFKEINLIGCDFSESEGKDYCLLGALGNERVQTKKFLKDAYYRMQVFTEEIIKVCKKYNIIINRFSDYKNYQNRLIKN